MTARNTPGSLAESVPRVLFLDQSGALGGAEMMLFDLVTAWPGDCEVVVLEEGAFPERLRAAGVGVSVVPLGAGAAGVRKGGSMGNALRAVPAVWRCARGVASVAKGCDVIYANTAKALVVGMLAGRLAKRPVVFHLHDLVTASHFSPVSRLTLVNLSNRAAAVVANSKASLAALRAAAGQPKRVAVVYNGFRAGDWTTSQAPAPARPPLQLGLFGRLTAWKGQHVAVEALTRLPPGAATLHLVGDALYGEADQTYAERLRADVADAGLVEAVRFLGQRDDVAALMHACDVVVHTSTAPEPFGRVIVEGMLCGKPVIATRGGGVEEIVTDGVTGLLVEPGDAAGLASAVLRLRDDPALAARLAEAGRTMAAERFTVERMVAGVRDVVEDVAQRHPVGRP